MAFTFKVPRWVKIALTVAGYIPLGPIWSAIDKALLLIVDQLPQDQQAQARVELDTASNHASQTGSPELHREWTKKYCSGVGCPPDLVRE
jgi:hypothetical protein